MRIKLTEQGGLIRPMLGLQSSSPPPVLILRRAWRATKTGRGKRRQGAGRLSSIVSGNQDNCPITRARF